MSTIIKKIFSLPTVVLLSALVLSSIAAWYSIVGLTAIFAAAVIPIIIMGASLELAKVVTTIWLHRYWEKCKTSMKVYLCSAVAILAIVTSMGIFGFLSKAHLDQSIPSGDVESQLRLIDEKITIQKDLIVSERENIQSARNALAQLDNQVNARLDRGTTEASAERSVQIRNQQRRERQALTKEISDSQSRIEQINNTIQQINLEKAPIAASYRKIEAEVGPIKYIAALLYGDDPDKNTLERAVRWVIILLIFVFDPLALVLVLAAISSYRWEFDKSDTSTENITNQNIDNNPKQPIEEKVVTDVVVNEEILPVKKKKVTKKPTDVKYKKVEYKPKRTKDKPKKIKSEDKKTTQDIVTEGVTPVHDKGNGYVEFEGKLFQSNALKEIRPDLFSAKNDVLSGNNIGSNFGTSFPKIASKGFIFVRVDVSPNKVYKFDGQKWIEINKEATQSYLYDADYMNFLANKVYSKEYDIELLTEHERSELEIFLKNKK